MQVSNLVKMLLVVFLWFYSVTIRQRFSIAARTSRWFSGWCGIRSFTWSDWLQIVPCIKVKVKDRVPVKGQEAGADEALFPPPPPSSLTFSTCMFNYKWKLHCCWEIFGDMTFNLCPRVPDLKRDRLKPPKFATEWKIIKFWVGRYLFKDSLVTCARCRGERVSQCKERKPWLVALKIVTNLNY